MDFNFLLPLLAMFTLLAALVFSLYSKAVTEKKRKDPYAPKSSLAKDGPGPQPLR
ncbi:MAG: hypothetical protein KKB02_19030 [Alphaproteobacteria bacterium]|nr:hypothetical protein [Alphaproteobacteria bacterium]